MNESINKLSIYLQSESPCILRPPVQPEKCGLKLQVILKWRNIYIEKIRLVSLIMEGIC